MTRKCHSIREDWVGEPSKYQLNRIMMSRAVQRWMARRTPVATAMPDDQVELPAGGVAVRIMGVNILVVLIAFSLALSGLIYARQYERALNVDGPVAEMLESDQWVERYVLDSKKGEIVIHPVWNDRMPAQLERLLEKVSEIAGDRYRLVRVVDTRTAELEDLFHYAHLAINQALATGDYLSMQRELDILAEDEGLDSAKVWVSRASAMALIKCGNNFMYESVGDSSVGEDSADGSCLAVRFEGP